MGIKKSISEFRNVTIEFNDEAPIDSYKGAIEFAADNEGKYAKLGATGVPDVNALSVIVGGTNPYQVHVFVVTTDMANSTYDFTYVETKPNADS
jgi:hypothetical protein